MAISPIEAVADSDYLLDRAAASANMACETSPEVAAIHNQLASAYLDQALGTTVPSGETYWTDVPPNGQERLELARSIFGQLAPVEVDHSVSDQPHFQSLLAMIP